MKPLIGPALTTIGVVVLLVALYLAWIPLGLIGTGAALVTAGLLIDIE